MAATSAEGLIGILGWDVDDFHWEVGNANTKMLQRALAMLSDPEDEGPEVYEARGERLYAAKARAGQYMIKKELHKRGIGERPINPMMGERGG